MTPTRTFRDETVDYAAVGATQAPDLMRYPPERATARGGRRGASAAARRASTAQPTPCMSWGVAARRGLEVDGRARRHRAAVLGRQLRRRGQRRSPSSRRRAPSERFDADGTPYVAAGHDGRARRSRAAACTPTRPLRVIFVDRRAATASASRSAPCRAPSRAARSRSCSSTATTTRCGSRSARSSARRGGFYRARRAAPCAASVASSPARDLRALHPAGGVRPMGSALPLGEPAPADGSLPASAADRRRTTARSASTCTCRSAACAAATATSTPTPPDELRGARQDDYADHAARARSDVAAACSRHPACRSGRPSTVFFGGGTPTLLPAERPRAHARRASATTFGIAPGAEVTIEANPDTVTPTTVAASSRQPGSRGSRSACSRPCRTCSRRSTARTIPNARPAVVGWARDAGPRRQPRPHLRHAGGVARRLAAHRSRRPSRSRPTTSRATRSSSRTAPSSPGRSAAARSPQPDDDLQADMYELADELLGAAGYEWYEVSNWARGRRAPLAPQPRVLAGRRLVGLRPRRAQPRRRRALVERRSIRPPTPSGSPRASRPRPGARLLDAATRETRARAAAHPHPRGDRHRRRCSPTAGTRSPGSSPTTSWTRKPPSPVR